MSYMRRRTDRPGTHAAQEPKSGAPEHESAVQDTRVVDTTKPHAGRRFYIVCRHAQH
jgi:hypothetical protein